MYDRYMTNKIHFNILMQNGICNTCLPPNQYAHLQNVLLFDQRAVHYHICTPRYLLAGCFILRVTEFIKSIVSTRQIRRCYPPSSNVLCWQTCTIICRCLAHHHYQQYSILAVFKLLKEGWFHNEGCPTAKKIKPYKYYGIFMCRQCPPVSDTSCLAVRTNCAI